MTALLDVNVLVALLDPAHAFHDAAHRWFEGREPVWASCPTTLLGCLRVLANPAYPEKRALMTIVESLRSLCDVPDHIHWADGPNVLTSVDITQLRGHRQITDAFLLATAVAHGGRLVTFDRNVPVRAVAGATPDHVEVLS